MTFSSSKSDRGFQRWRMWLIGLVVAIIAVLAANTIWVDSRTRPAAPREGGKIIDTSVEPANVKVEGQGPTILLLHGFGAAINWWDNVAPALAAHHCVIRADLIGHGGTAAPAIGYAITRQAQLAASLLDKFDVGHVTVEGHSMGGEVAVALAESSPERIDHMILTDSPPTAGATFTMMTKIYLMPVVGEMLSHFETDEGNPERPGTRIRAKLSGSRSVRDRSETVDLLRFSISTR